MARKSTEAKDLSPSTYMYLSVGYSQNIEDYNE